MNDKFAITDLSSYMQEALEMQGISQLSDVQAAVIPKMMEGRDLFVRASTASGKTYSFLIPILEKHELQGKGKHFPKALILVPTRELALQTADVCRKLLSRTEGIRTAVLCGGEDITKQIRQYSKGADIVIATPSRLLDHLRRHTFKPKECTVLVLDEADVMLSMGFLEDVLDIIDELPVHQTVMLSATFPMEIRNLAEEIMPVHKIVEIAEETVHTQSIVYHAYIVEENRKLDTAAQLIRRMNQPVIVFCNKRTTCDFVREQLHKRGLDVQSIHSGTNMKTRRGTMQLFRSGRFDVLVSTDVLSRGIDVPSTGAVILYDYPENEETVIHRTGRTSRSGNIGTAIFLLTPKERFRLKQAESILETEIEMHRVKDNQHR